jgi:hypothetical protein
MLVRPKLPHASAQDRAWRLHLKSGRSEITNDRLKQRRNHLLVNRLPLFLPIGQFFYREHKLG